MIERSHTITTADGEMPVNVFCPDRGRHPLVILYMDAYGIRQELRVNAGRKPLISGG